MMKHYQYFYLHNNSTPDTSPLLDSFLPPISPIYEQEQNHNHKHNKIKKSSGVNSNNRRGGPRHQTAFTPQTFLRVFHFYHLSMPYIAPICRSIVPAYRWSIVRRKYYIMHSSHTIITCCVGRISTTSFSIL